MKIINLTIVKLAVSFSSGILLAHFVIPTAINCVKLLPFCFALLVLIFLWRRKNLFPSLHFTLITLLTFVIFGVGSYQLQLPSFQSTHYSSCIELESQIIRLKIKEVLRPDNFSHKYIATVNSIDEKKANGDILLLIHKDSIFAELMTDQELMISAKLQPIPKPLNPEQFRYDRYMKTLGVYHQTRIQHHSIFAKQNGKSTIKGFANRFRNRLIRNLDKTSLTAEARSILQALVLGEKRDIDRELYRSYAAAGAVHILAVSGLHVGILFLLFSRLFSFVLLLPKGKWIRSLLIVISLWFFALVAGFSPSVVRAVTMFSFLAIAQILNRPTSTFNTLFLSYFILLIVNPLWLFQVGFQLSYLAVFMIIWIQPWLYSFFKPRFYLDKLLWGTITVSVAAQIGVAPLSLYYFHQFPGLFLLTNIVVLPFLGILLCYGLVVVILASLGVLPIWLANVFSILVNRLNDFISWVASHDFFILKGIHLTPLEVILFYLMMVTLVLFLRKSRSKLLIYALGIMVIFQIYSWFEEKEYSEERLIVFNKNRETLITYETNKEIYMLSSNPSIRHDRNYPLKNYFINREVKNGHPVLIPTYFKFRNKTIQILDSTGVYDPANELEAIVIINSPKINLNRLIDSIKPEIIIADGSNYRSFVERWRETCRTKKLPFHHTGTKGAFIWE